MEINITLILQALQFACAYCFLYKFVFTPACIILDENDKFENELYQNLEKAQQVKDALLQDYHVKNNACKSVLLDAIPELTIDTVCKKSMVNSASYKVEQITLSQEEIKKTEAFLVDHLSQVIKK